MMLYKNNFQFIEEFVNLIFLMTRVHNLVHKRTYFNLRVFVSTKAAES